MAAQPDCPGSPSLFTRRAMDRVPYRGRREIQEDAGIHRTFWRRAADPVTEWIAIADGQSDAAPVWSPDGNLLYFFSDIDGSRCIWARRLDLKTKRPVGEPFAVLHRHEKQDMTPWHVWVGKDSLMYY
jgi:hypothetical protein